jgi:hypothetical protein
VKENGNTSITVPDIIGNTQVTEAVGSLVQKGSLMLNVNGPVSIDIKVTSNEKRFGQSRVFQASESGSLQPFTNVPGTDTGVADALRELCQLKDTVGVWQNCS